MQGKLEGDSSSRSIRIHLQYPKNLSLPSIYSKQLSKITEELCLCPVNKSFLLVAHFKLVIPQIIKGQQQKNNNKKTEKKGLAIFCEYYVAVVDYIVVVSFTQLHCVTK